MSPRSRPHWIAMAALTLALGLLTRPLKRYADALGSALGDALWALMVFLLLGALFPRLAPRHLFIAATAIAFLVELSQLWHTPLLDTFRHTTVGALTIGGSFHADDLLWYLLGTTVGHAIDTRRKQ